jgi:nicotinamidase-related amidase
MTIENLDAMLQKAFDESTKIYQQRGFQRRIGFGRKPGLVSVDLANAWTLPGNPFTCERIDEEIIPGMQRLLAACRTNGHVVVHVTTAYQITDRDDPKSDMGLWHHKVPVESVNIKDEHLWAIDTRIATIEGEYVTATACVRTTICDGLAEGFRTIAVRECIGDRVPGAVAWNLFDIDAKFADVESVDTCVNYLNNVDGFNQKARLSG